MIVVEKVGFSLVFMVVINLLVGVFGKMLLL